MCMFKPEDRVVYKSNYGTVIGYFSGDFCIVLFDFPLDKGERGKVIHSADLQPITPIYNTLIT